MHHLPEGRWNSAEIRKLAPAERDAILEDAAALLESEYRTNPELTDFEAFGEADLHDGDTAADAG